MKFRFFYFLILFLLIRTQSFAQCSRAQVINDYNTIYLQTSVSDAQLAWTGNTSTCTAGTISDLAQTNTLARVNYYRKLAGLQTLVTFDATNNIKCQQAALMMMVNNSINHNPPVSWLCYTSDGAQAALYSNLVMGVHSSAAVDLCMNDNGIASVGHRRLILNSKPPVFGHGSTNTSDAMWVIGSGTVADTGYITFPSAGFFPAPLIPSSKYWSFGLSSASFTSSTIQMFDESGSEVSIVQLPIQNGYGDNTIVWQPSNIITNSSYDVKYNVKVNNVLVGSEYKNYSYNVILCQPLHPPQCPSGQAWSETNCACTIITGIDEYEVQGTNVIVRNPFSDLLETKICSIKGGDMKIYIMDLAGKELGKRSISVTAGEELTLYWNSSEWHNGLYFIIVEGQNKTRKTYKAIKQ